MALGVSKGDDFFLLGVVVSCPLFSVSSFGAPLVTTLRARLVARGYSDPGSNNQRLYKWHAVRRFTANAGVLTVCGRKFAVNGVRLRDVPTTCARCISRSGQGQ